MTMLASEQGTKSYDLLAGRALEATPLDVAELLKGMSGIVCESCVEFAQPQAETLNEVILTELNARQNRAEPKFGRVMVLVDRAISEGDDVDSADAAKRAGVGGVMMYTLGDLRTAFDGVRLEHVKVGLVTGGAFVSPVALLAALQRERNVSAFSDANFGADPFGTLSRVGELPRSIPQALAMVADMAIWTSQHRPRSKAVRVSTRAYRRLAASPAQEIAFAVATAQAYLKAMLDAGMTPAQASKQFVFEVSVGPDTTIAAAKLSVIRKYWLDILNSLGVSAEEAKLIVSLVPVGGPDVTRTEGFILDPIPQLADKFAVGAAVVLRAIEAQGGMGSAIASGWVRAQLKESTCKCGGGGCGGGATAPEVMTDAVQRIRDWRAAHPQARPALEKLREVLRTSLGTGEVTEYAVRAAVAGATVGQIAAALLATQDTIHIPSEAHA